MNTPLVSVIMPCCNQAEFMPETLDCLKRQSLSEWECIMVDDGSVDNTEDVARKYCEADRRFIYIKQVNQGPSTARNNAIAHSHGKYILPLDSDDLIGEEYLKLASDILNERDDIKVVYCKAEYFGAKKGEWKLPDFNWEHFIIRNSIFCTAMFRRSDFDKTPGYNTDMRDGFEDWDFWISLLKEGGKVFRIPQTLFYYRQKSSSRNTDIKKDKEKRLNAIYTIVRNHPEVYHSQYSLLYNKCSSILNSRLYRFLVKLKKLFRH